MIHFPFDRFNPLANHSWGTALAIRRSAIPRSALFRTWTPDSEVEGRGGIIRIRMGSGPDFCLGSLYIPPQGAFPICIKVPYFGIGVHRLFLLNLNAPYQSLVQMQTRDLEVQF